MTFSWFTNGTCTSTRVGDVEPVLLTPGVADAMMFTQTPLAPGMFRRPGHLLGNGTYAGRPGREPLTVTPLVSSTATVIHDSTDNAGYVGACRHDGARSGDGDRRLGTPTGTVTFSWFTNGTCAGTPAATSTRSPWRAVSRTATTFTLTPSVSGSFVFQATYWANGTYNGSTGPCEPLTSHAARARHGDGDPRRHRCW